MYMESRNGTDECIPIHLYSLQEYTEWMLCGTQQRKERVGANQRGALTLYSTKWKVDCQGEVAHNTGELSPAL